MAFFSQVIEDILSSNAEIGVDDIIGNMKKFIKKGISESEGKIKSITKKKKRLESLMKRFKYKGNQSNIAESICNLQLGKLANQITAQKEHIETGREMIKLLDDYEFEVDKVNKDEWVTAFDKTINGAFTNPAGTIFG